MGRCSINDLHEAIHAIDFAVEAYQSGEDREKFDAQEEACDRARDFIYSEIRQRHKAAKRRKFLKTIREVRGASQ